MFGREINLPIQIERQAGHALGFNTTHLEQIVVGIIHIVVQNRDDVARRNGQNDIVNLLGLPGVC